MPMLLMDDEKLDDFFRQCKPDEEAYDLTAADVIEYVRCEATQLTDFQDELLDCFREGDGTFNGRECGEYAFNVNDVEFALTLDKSGERYDLRITNGDKKPFYLRTLSLENLKGLTSDLAHAFRDFRYGI